MEVGDTYNLVLADSDSGVFTAEWNGTFGEWIRPVREDGSSAEMGVKLTKNDDGTYKIDLYDNYNELYDGHISIDIYQAEVKTLDPKYLPKVSALDETWIAELKTALGI